MTTLAETDFEVAWRDFRDAREAEIQAPYGFLAITGLHWLGAQPQRFDGIPGEWSVGPDGVLVTLGDGEVLSISGAPVSGGYELGQVGENGVVAEFPGAVIEIAERFGMILLRPRQAESAGLKTYAGTPTYEPDVQWLIPARFEAYAEPRPTPVDSVVEGKGSVIDAIGELIFTIYGRPQCLVVFEDDDVEDGLWLLFTDETSGVTTYAATRQLHVDQPDENGRVTLDFNRALNMPCAYTDYATCPLPPLGNHVDVLVEAGEKIPPRCV